jgi:hypothetical protein
MAVRWVGLRPVSRLAAFGVVGAAMSDTQMNTPPRRSRLAAAV